MIEKIDKFKNLLVVSLMWVSMVGLFSMMLITWMDVIGGKFFNLPVPGLTDLLSPLHLIIIASTIAFTEIKGMHVRVLFLVTILPRRSLKVLNGIVCAIMIVFFALLGWEAYEYGVSLLQSGNTTGTLLIPLWPLAFWFALSCFAAWTVFLVNFLYLIAKRPEK